MSLDIVLTLGIPVGTTDTKFSRKVFIQEYLKNLDIQKGEETVRWGIGVRWIVNFKTLDVQAKTASITMIVASAQVGYVEAEARFQVIGIGSRDITTAIPAPVSLFVASQNMNKPDSSNSHFDIGIPYDMDIKENPVISPISGVITEILFQNHQEECPETGCVITICANQIIKNQENLNAKRFVPILVISISKM